MDVLQVVSGETVRTLEGISLTIAQSLTVLMLETLHRLYRLVKDFKSTRQEIVRALQQILRQLRRVVIPPIASQVQETPHVSLVGIQTI